MLHQHMLWTYTRTLCVCGACLPTWLKQGPYPSPRAKKRWNFLKIALVSDRERRWPYQYLCPSLCRFVIMTGLNEGLARPSS